MTRRRRRGPSGGADTRALVEAAAREAADRRGQDVVVLDLRGLTSATDYFVIASGESDVQVKAIAARIEERLEKDEVRPWHVEGLRNARWILLDYVDFVVHVFHKAARRYYERWFALAAFMWGCGYSPWRWHAICDGVERPKDRFKGFGE